MGRRPERQPRRHPPAQPAAARPAGHPRRRGRHPLPPGPRRTRRGRRLLRRPPPRTQDLGHPARRCVRQRSRGGGCHGPRPLRARAAAIQAGGPATVLRQVNDVLRRDQADLDDPRFATMLFGRLRPRPEALEIAFSLGGHPRPFVVRRDGTLQVVGRPGTLLGVLVDTTFANTTVSLGLGDAFIAVTDGVLEGRDDDGRELGDHLASVLAAHAGGCRVHHRRRHRGRRAGVAARTTQG
ncbi:MAG: PP2C family protein-serine/threonine phosphatase [Acidimicrobiales bacterium]